MQLIINGEAQTIAATTLLQLLTALDYEGDWLATEAKSRHACFSALHVTPRRRS